MTDFWGLSSVLVWHKILFLYPFMVSEFANDSDF